MTRILPLAFIAAFPAIAGAERGATAPQPIQSGTLESLRWQARPVVIFGDGAPLAAQVLAMTEDPQAIADRDIVVLIDGPGAGPLRERAGSGFAVMLIGKDGGVKEIWHEPVDPEEIFALIDAMPMRQREAAEDG